MEHQEELSEQTKQSQAEFKMQNNKIQTKLNLPGVLDKFLKLADIWSVLVMI